jgi:hypothetical protein
VISQRLDGVLGFCTNYRHTFPMIAKLGQGCLEAARAAGISAMWRRVPITTVTIALVSAIWLYDYVSVSPASASATPRTSASVDHPVPIPSKPLLESKPANSRTQTGRAQDAKARFSGFRRKRVGQNEVDYVAEDVTIRLFTPNSAPMRVPHVSRQVHIGQDVTVRYFEYEPALGSKTRPGSAAAQSQERSLLVSK